MEVEVSRKESALKESQFLASDNLELRELQSEKIRLLLEPSLAVHTYIMLEYWIGLLILILCHECSFPVTLIHSARFLHLMLDNRQATAKMPYEMSLQTSFETQLYFRAMALMIRESGVKS